MSDEIKTGAQVLGEISNSTICVDREKYRQLQSQLKEARDLIVEWHKLEGPVIATDDEEIVRLQMRMAHYRKMSEFAVKIGGGDDQTR